MNWAIDQIRRLGIGRCILQADGEPAQRTFVKDVIDEVCRTSAVGVAPAHTPAHDHQANGAVESDQECEGPRQDHDERAR